jgi:quinol monooxygenase YgiN
MTQLFIYRPRRRLRRLAQRLRSSHRGTFAPVWRGQDDPNLVIVWEEWDSREAAEASFGDERTAQIMARAGVDASSVRIEYVDEVT